MSKVAKMIHFYFGENSFEMQQQVANVAAKFADKYGAENISKIDASGIDAQKLIAEIVNINLFAPRRLLVVRGAASNKNAWAAIGENLTRVPDETELIIIVPSPDKRTKTFKELKKNARTREFALPKNHDLTEWVLRQAANQKVEIKRAAADELILATAGDPWRIANELAKFRALDAVATPERVRDLVEYDISASAFNLLDDLLNGRRQRALDELAKLRQVEDANKFLGLLASQIFALSGAVNAGDKAVAEVASDLSVHPFVMSKMFSAARKMTPREAARLARIVAETDAKMKSTGADPWRLIELAIAKF
ncbi:MAG: DNA polymerase III subunit delta [Candidatus Nomurabacteria bacterium]|jgi:DNA polymerase-3 subunit delta|nr:DNA polymerase III subunit delta [Candidatus Nomurabacteria bacterium]